MSSESGSDEVHYKDPGPNPWGRKKIKLDPKKLTSEEKEYLGKAILAKKLTPKIIHERYELKEDTVRYYAEKVRKGDHLYGHGGRPTYLDKIGEQELIKEVNPKFYNHEKEMLEDIVKGIGEKTAERRGKDPKNVKLPSARLLRSMKKNFHIKIGKLNGMRTVNVNNDAISKVEQEKLTTKLAEAPSRKRKLVAKNDNEKIPRILKWMKARDLKAGAD